MLVDLLTWLHDTGFATELRHGRWAYPVVNTCHILGIALLFGGIVPLDLRLMGLWPSVPPDTLARVLVPVAAGGAVLAVATGFLLFSVHPVKYVGTALFQAKMVFVLCGLVNALLLRRLGVWAGGSRYRLRAGGTLSFGFWLAAIVCGRFLGYI